MRAKTFYNAVQEITSKYDELKNLNEKIQSMPSLNSQVEFSEIEILINDYQMDNFTILNYLSLRNNYIKDDGYFNFITGESFALQFNQNDKEKIVYFSYDDRNVKKLFCNGTSSCLNVVYCLFELYVLRKANVIDFEDRKTHDQYLKKCLEFTKGHGEEFLYYELLIMSGL